MSMIADNLAAIRARIAEAERRAGRDSGAVKLVAVSKTHPAVAVAAAYQAGQRLFGENRVQEAARKYAPLKAQYPDLRLHLLGALQTNKAEAAVALFDVIETLDRPKLAQALAAAMYRHKRRPDLLIEVNLGAEPQKAGILPPDLPEFMARCRDEWDLPVRGLMGIPPQHGPPEPYFRRLAQLAGAHGLPECSMGMSGDFAAAIACGATEIRIGTAIFGERPQDASPDQ